RARGGAPGARVARARRPARIRRALPGAALGGHETASRHRARPGQRAPHPLDGRAVRRVGRADALGDAGPPLADLRHRRRDRAVHHARPRRGHLPLRSHRGARLEPGSRSRNHRGPRGSAARAGTVPFRSLPGDEEAPGRIDSSARNRPETNLGHDPSRLIGTTRSARASRSSSGDRAERRDDPAPSCRTAAQDGGAAEASSMPSDANTERVGAVLLEEPLRGGQEWARGPRRGQTLTVVDVEGGAAIAALFFNAEQPLERYNMPDTLKAQHVARLTAGTVLFSDMGRVLCSIVRDTAGWHDTITGHMTAEMSERK